MSETHLVVTTANVDSVAVIRTATGWRLPSFENVPLPETVRRIEARLAQAGGADIVHWAPVPPVDTLTHGVPRGAFLPTAKQGDQWYCVSVAQTGSVNGPARMVDAEQIAADGVLPGPHQAAVRIALARVRAPRAAFDSPAAVKAALEWAGEHMAGGTDAQNARIVSVTRHRCTRHELVVRLQTKSQSAYLKAGIERGADEALLTEYLRGVRPLQFPDTLAFDRHHGRWLYRELPGVPLADAPPTRGDVRAVVRALASLQKDTIDSPTIAAHLAHRRLDARGLLDEVEDIAARAWRSAPPATEHARLQAAWQTMRETIGQICSAVDGLRVPSGLVLSDFWSQNIIVTQHGIGFIDVGNSYWSYPFLSLWRFIRDIERRRSPAAPMRVLIEQAFVDEWASVVPRREMTAGVASLWLLGRLFGILMASCDLDRYEQALGTALPAGYRAARLAPRIRDLLQTLARRLRVPRLAEPEATSAPHEKSSPPS